MINMTEKYNNADNTDSNGTEIIQCAECGNDTILFDPQPPPYRNRFICPACSHKWRVPECNIKPGTN